MPVFQTGEVLLKKLTIERLIGQGAFGEVYLAQHDYLKTPRALKVLRRGMPGVGSEVYQGFIDRFTLEAKLGENINDSHVIRVFEFEPDEPSQTLILQMEYASGGSLSTRLNANRQNAICFEIEEALRIAREIATGLACLHKRDIVHRDLSPGNVLFDARGSAKIADLGLAQIPGGGSMRSRISGLQPQPGTPGYMSPEQENNGITLKPASDVYTLGLLLFEMLTGRNHGMCRPGTRLRSLRADAPVGLDEILERMLAENWRMRPFDGEEIGVLLQSELDQIVLEREQREAAERARLEAAAWAQREAEERLKREAIEHARQEEAERVRLEAAALAQREAEERAKREAAERAALEKRQHEAAERARLEAAALAQREAEEKAKRVVAQRAALEKKQREAERRLVWLIGLAGGGVGLLCLIFLGLWLNSISGSSGSGPSTATPTATVITVTAESTATLTLTPILTSTLTVTDTLTRVPTNTPRTTGSATPTPSLTSTTRIYPANTSYVYPTNTSVSNQSPVSQPTIAPPPTAVPTVAKPPTAVPTIAQPPTTAPTSVVRPPTPTPP